jgi:hypothetical protein
MKNKLNEKIKKNQIISRKNHPAENCFEKERKKKLRLLEIK